MARLTRKNINVFAGSASNNGVFGSLQAGNATVSNDVETIQSLSEAWSGGWNYATMTGEKLPPLEEFQGVQYVTTYQQAYLMQEGMPEWSASVTYYKGSLTKKVTSTGFQIYNSLTDNNTNHQLSDTANWKLVMDSDNLYALDSAVVHIAGAETITGNKTFSNGYKSTNGLLYNDNITKGTAPSSNTQYINMYMVGDSRTSGDSNALGLFRTYVTTSNIVYSTMQAFKNVASSGASSALRTYYHTAQNKFGVEFQALSTGTDTNESMALITNATDSPKIPTMGWVNNPATSTNVVHRSGTETITGSKTFTNAINVKTDRPTVYLRENDAIKGSLPSNDQIWAIYNQDSSDSSTESSRLGSFMTQVTTMGAIGSEMRVYKYASNSTEHASIRIYYPFIGSAQVYTSAPTPHTTTSDSDTQIATTGWVNSVGNNIVHRTGNEIIAGTKTFTSNVKVSNGDPRVQIINSGVTKGTAPASGEVQGVSFRDKDEKLLGVVQSQYGDSTGTSKATLTKIVAYKASSASDTANANISVGYDSSGNVYTYAPTPSSSSDHSTKIATTDWCQTAFANAIGTPRDVTILWGNGTGSGSPTEFSLSEEFTNFEQIGLVCATDSGDFRNICIESTYWLNWLLSNSGSHSVQLGRSGTSNFAIRSYTASSNPSTNTKFKVAYEDGICYYIFGINRKVKTVTDPLA